MENKRHNGWTNYATWRVHLELFEDYEFFIDYTIESLEDFAYMHLEEDCNNKLTLDYASAFIREVDFVEIYDAIQDWKNEYKCPECDADVEGGGTCSKECEDAQMY